MGSLYQRGKYFHYQFKDETGSWNRVTTKKTTQREAELWVSRFLHEQSHKFQPQFKPPEQVTYTYSDLKEKIYKHCQSNLCMNSANIVYKVLHEFEKIVYHKLLNDINDDDIEDYKIQRQKEIQKATVNRDIITLRTIFNLAIKWKMINENPAQYTKKIRVEQKEIHVFEQEDITKLLNTMNEENYSHFANITLFGLYTGMRLNEIINLQWNDVDLKDRKIIVRNKPNFKTKTGKIRHIPISDKLMEVIQKLIPKIYSSDELIFSNTWKGVYTKTYISKKFKHFVRKAGLNDVLHFHCLRHTFITKLLQNNVSIVKAQKLAGHSNIKTTLIYTHLNIEDLRSAVNIF